VLEKKKENKKLRLAEFHPREFFFLTLSVVVFTGGLPSVAGGSGDEESCEENWGERGRGGRRRRRRRDGIRGH
jgi:hypothetical protein